MTKHLVLILSLFAVGSVFADVPSRIIDGNRVYNGTELEAGFQLPCDSAEGVTLNAAVTPGVLQLVPSLKRSGRIYNNGTTYVFYRISQWGLPPNWATVNERIAPGSGVTLDLSGIQQVWVWNAAVQTPAPSYSGCYAANAPAYVPTVTPTITPTVTPTATPTA